VHPGAVAAARRAGVDLGAARPRPFTGVPGRTTVITVCDRAHEELGAAAAVAALHWSIPDPVPSGRARDFDAVVSELRARISSVTGVAA
jgi:protein-tyrosine-phosphatase